MLKPFNFEIILRIYLEQNFRKNNFTTKSLILAQDER